MEHPTLLCIPTLGSWGWGEGQHILPLRPDDYRVVESPEGWKVRAPDGALVYFGPGPARVRVSPATF